MVHYSQTDTCKWISDLFALGLQRDPEQSVCSLVQKVGVQHPYFTVVTQPDLRRAPPKAFSDLEITHKH